MKTAAELEHSFAKRGTRRGGMLLLSPSDALAFVEAARTSKIRVLGVDSFVLSENEVRPQMDHILDLSSAPSTLETWTVASQFISHRELLGFHFEVVV